MPVDTRRLLNRGSAIAVVFVTTCLAQTVGKDQCPGSQICTGQGFLLLAEEAFDGGRLADALRYASSAIRIVEADPNNAQLLIGILRVQSATYIEQGKLSEALAIMERLKALPGGSPEQSAAIRGLKGACYQAAGDLPAAEREYVQAIREWDSLNRGAGSVPERSNLGVLYIAAGRFDEAIAVLQQAYAALADSRKKTAYHRLVLTNNLAVAHSQRGDTALAERYARDAVRLAEGSGVGRYQLTASVYSNCAEVLRSAGYKKDAHELEDRARRAEAMANTLVDYSDLRSRGKRRP